MAPPIGLRITLNLVSRRTVELTRRREFNSSFILHPCISRSRRSRCNDLLGRSPILLIARTLQQNDAQKKRHDQWKGRNTEDHARTSVPRDGLSRRVRMLDERDHDEDKGDDIQEDICE